MTAVAIPTKQLAIPAEREQEILARIDRAGLHICEAEPRYKLRWDERTDGSLLDVLDELERRGLVESSLHFRLSQCGREQLPDDYEPPPRYGTGIPWEVRCLTARFRRDRRCSPSSVSSARAVASSATTTMTGSGESHDRRGRSKACDQGLPARGPAGRVSGGLYVRAPRSACRTGLATRPASCVAIRGALPDPRTPRPRRIRAGH
jgi:hypothetical protein